jgi:hypothetical protein
LTTQRKAASANIVRKPSRMDVRLMTMAWPSVARKSPAMSVSAGLRKRLYARRHRSSTVMTPQIAVVMRQPTGSACPKIFMPRAMIHFPVGGWTA